MGQLKKFWQPSDAHRDVAGPLGQLKIIGQPKAANNQFYFLIFEKTYMTTACLKDYPSDVALTKRFYLNVRETILL